MDLNERICRYLAACPPAISGSKGHNATFTVACALVNGFGLDDSQALHYLRLYNDRCQPPWEEKDLVHKVASANSAQHSKIRGHLIGDTKFGKDDFRSSSFESRAPQPKTKIDPSTAIEIFLKGFTCAEADIHEASPVKPPEDFAMDAVCLLENLYNKGEVVNFVTDFKLYKPKDAPEKAIPMGYGQSVERDELIDLWSLGMPQSEAGGWFRMNPVNGGISDKDVTHFRFVLLEFDSIPIDLQLSLFARLPLPIAAILSSGGKSLHAWVKVDEKDMTGYKDTAVALLKMLEKFGLDDKNKNPSRLSRMVGVTRKIGASGDGRQRLIYLNHEPTQRGIL